MGLRQRQGFGMQLDSTYVASEFADNRMTLAPSADGTVGQIPRSTVWNVNADYVMAREGLEVRPYVTVKNLTDRRYIASRAPQGIQPGCFGSSTSGSGFRFEGVGRDSAWAESSRRIDSVPANPGNCSGRRGRRFDRYRFSAATVPAPKCAPLLHP